MFKSYKNRTIDFSKPVEIYRCLNKKGVVYSIRQNGLVVSHTTNFVLKDCTFLINKSGKQLSIKTQIRNVHAFIKGYLTTHDDIKNTFSYQLFYYPFLNKKFIVNNQEIEKADIVYTQENKVMVQ